MSDNQFFKVILRFKSYYILTDKKQKGEPAMKILLVEDEKHLSEAVVHILKKNHYSADAVYNGCDGLDYGLSNI